MTVHSFYPSRRVLVTGLTGFKGVWLASWLEHLGSNVLGVGLAPSAEVRQGWPGIEDRFPWEEVDIRDADAVREVFARFQPEVVFHLAAQPLVRHSYLKPVETFATNVLGTVHVLEAVRHTPSVRAVVNVTSDKCYENREWLWGYREEEPMGGSDPYSASKGCAELVASAYRRSFTDAGLAPIASARAGNVIGGGDWGEDRLVPDLIRSLTASKPLVIRRPQAIRPWQHVLEALSGYLLLGERLASDPGHASGWNFGPLEVEMIPVRELAREMIRLWGSGELVEAPTPGGPHEAHFLKLDASKAVSLLRWRPLLGFHDRLDWTVDWYRSWREQPGAVWDKTLEQILRYEDRIQALPSLHELWADEQPASPTPLPHAA